jgi:hypothetical protein
MTGGCIPAHFGGARLPGRDARRSGGNIQPGGNIAVRREQSCRECAPVSAGDMEGI